MRRIKSLVTPTYSTLLCVFATKYTYDSVCMRCSLLGRTVSLSTSCRDGYIIRKYCLNGAKYVKTLLAYRTNKPSNTSEVFGALIRPKTTRYFLFTLHHT